LKNFSETFKKPLDELEFEEIGRKKREELRGLRRTLGWISDFTEVCGELLMYQAFDRFN
jgi:hypothetical protein